MKSGSPSAAGGSAAPISPPAAAAAEPRERARTGALRPELLGLLALTALLNLWALSRNGWANDYYSAAVRSMSSSWHNFLFGSLDPSGVMTVDKPPLALWVQALSVRVFGYHPLSVLVPQALMGVASVALLYDLVRRRFGRVGGFIGGLVLALTPITVAISRHNNPDALLVLCCVAALWCAVRALENGSTRWLVLAGVCVGLGFETKMGVALVVVPAIAAAWLWVAPAARGRLQALRALLVGLAAMVAVGGAWPALVELTPAADRPWISGTSTNTIFSLIFEYNGLGRVEGQAGGPGGAGGNMFGGTPGPLRLLNSALGGQAGWLLGFALVAGVGILLSSRLRTRDPRSGWLIAVGGALLTTAVLFSFASGIFHPYYVSLLAPFSAALVGAGAAQLISGRINVRIFGPAAILAGVITELVVQGADSSYLAWLVPVLIVGGLIAAGALAVAANRRTRAIAVAGALALLLIAPAAWAVDTLGHATSGTFPAGGPALASQGGPGGFGAGAPGGGSRPPFGGAAPSGTGGAPTQLFGPAGARGPEGGGIPGAGGGLPSGGPGAGAGGAPGGGGFGGASLTSFISYADEHGGGTIAVASQSGAASSIIQQNANVAGIGGFSGRESDVSVSWLADEVAAGKIRWVLDEQSSSGKAAVSTRTLGAGFGGAPGGDFGRGFGGGLGGGLPGDSRTGATTAITAAAKACVKVSAASGASSSAAASAGALYDCKGRASELRSLGA